MRLPEFYLTPRLRRGARLPAAASFPPSRPEKGTNAGRCHSDRSRLFVAMGALGLTFAVGGPAALAAVPHASERSPGRAVRSGTARAVYARLPLAFALVAHSPGGSAQFCASGSGFGLLLNPTTATLALHSRRPATGPVEAVGCARCAAPGARFQRQLLTGRGSAASFGPRPLSPAAVVRLRWDGANPHPRAMGLEELPGKVRCYVGADPRQWDDGSALYAKVRYEGVYPGIDLIYHGNQRQLEYDWRVAPAADPGRIRLAVQGARSLSLDARGDMVIRTASGTICQRRPCLYQERAGRRQLIAGGYVLRGRDQVGFRVGAYDRGRPLVIDPTLAYSTFLGGTGPDQGSALALDGSGYVYITGVANLPTLWPTTPGALQTRASATAGGAFVTKLDLTKPGAAALVYSTYLGTTDVGTGIAVDGAGNAYVAGNAFAATLPTTPGAFQSSFGKGTEDAFAAKLSPGGALVYATYLGGSVGQEAAGIAIDPAGNASLVGDTGSSDFPTTPNAFQRLPQSTAPHVFVTKLDPTGQPVYSTLLGGSQGEFGTAIAADAAGDAYLTGLTSSPNFPATPDAAQKQLSPPTPDGNGSVDAFVTKFSPGGTLLYSTFLGGAGGSGGFGIAVDGTQSIYVTGGTQSASFPVTPGAFQSTYRGNGNPNAFAARISATGGLIYSTYLGGSGGDQGNAVAVDAAGDAFVTGSTGSPDFIVTPSGLQTVIGRAADGSPTLDAFATVVEPGGKFLFYSTYLGGSGDDTGTGIALDSKGAVYLAGTTDSPNFPTTPGAAQPAFGGDQNKAANSIEGDAFVAKISFTP